MVYLNNFSNKDAAHMAAAKVYASLSTAKRLKVGAVIVKDNRIISVGYNGTPTGFDNKCEYELAEEYVTKKEVCHAEMNAIMFAAKNGMSTDGCSIYTTHSPCFECSKMIIQSGIKEIFYSEEYRDLDGIDMLEKARLKVYKIDNSYVKT